MKVEQKESAFNPVIITLQSAEEVLWLTIALDCIDDTGSERDDFYNALYEKLEEVK